MQLFYCASSTRMLSVETLESVLHFRRSISAENSSLNQKRTIFFHRDDLAGFRYISSNHPCGLGYAQAARLRRAKRLLSVSPQFSLQGKQLQSREKSKPLSFPDSNNQKEKNQDQNNHALRCSRKKECLHLFSFVTNVTFDWHT